MHVICGYSSGFTRKLCVKKPFSLPLKMHRYSTLTDDAPAMKLQERSDGGYRGEVPLLGEWPWHNVVANDSDDEQHDLDEEYWELQGASDTLDDVVLRLLERSVVRGQIRQ